MQRKFFILANRLMSKTRDQMLRQTIGVGVGRQIDLRRTVKGSAPQTRLNLAAGIGCQCINQIGFALAGLAIESEGQRFLRRGGKISGATGAAAQPD